MTGSFAVQSLGSNGLPADGMNKYDASFPLWEEVGKVSR